MAAYATVNVKNLEKAQPEEEDPQLEGLPHKYQFIRKLGSGTFGDVYEYYDLGAESNVAVKSLELLNKFDSLPSNLLREISILKETSHENLMSLLDVCVAGTKVFIVFELLDASLEDIIFEDCPSVSASKIILHGILSGLHHLHEHGIIHRDLCPANILLDKERKTVKIADFGLARYTSDLHERYTHTECTYEYTAPEQLLSAPYSFPVDVWAAGCIFAQMVKKGDTLLSYNRELASVASIARVLGTPHEKSWPGVTRHSPSLSSLSFQSGQGLTQKVPGLDSTGLDLLSKLMAVDPGKRITAEDALKHPYFQYDMGEGVEL